MGDPKSRRDGRDKRIIRRFIVDRVSLCLARTGPTTVRGEVVDGLPREKKVAAAEKYCLCVTFYYVEQVRARAIAQTNNAVRVRA